MLEECCDDCNVPLMRNRAKTSMICCECDKDWLKKDTPKKEAPKQDNQEEAAKRLDQEKKKILEARLAEK
jgi:uncharacterized Zn finger protein (UPF0148 family)